MRNVVGVGLSAGIYAGAAVLLGNPIGAVGGAVYGTVQALLGLGVNKLLPNSTGERVRSVATQLFPVLAAWQLVRLFGVNMSLRSLVLLSIVGIPVGVGVVGLIAVIGVTAFGIDSKKSRSNCSEKPLQSEYV